MRDTLKLVIKTATLTLAAIVASAIFILLLLSFAAPAAMAKFTGDIGMYNQCAFYDSLAYADGDGKIEYIVDAMNCSVRTENHKKVIRYGTALIADERFEEYCTAQEQWEEENFGKMLESYNQYVYGVISVSYYYDGQTREAIELALSINRTSFEKYNAVTDLVRVVIVTTGESGDKTFAREILADLTALREGGTVADCTSLDEMILSLTQYTD